MSPAIWLIAEDETDCDVIQRILNKKGFKVVIRRVQLSGASGGISRLATQLPRLIKVVRNNKYWHDGDCIVVLHDRDAHLLGRHNAEYNMIAAVCKKENAIHLLADDTIESWLLADNGICQFLGIKPSTWDGKPGAKIRIESLLGTKHMQYQAQGREKLIEKLDGTGDMRSPSMRESMKKLIDAECIAMEPQ